MPDDATPICNLPAERTALGAMLRDEGAADHGLTLLRREDFHDYLHQLVYAAIAHLRAAGSPAHPDLVFARLVERGEQKALGGQEETTASFLARLYESDVTGAYIDYAASKVRDCSLRRAIVRQAREAIRDAQDGANPGEELAAVAAEAMARIAMPAGGRGPKLLSALVHQAVTRYDRQIKGDLPSRFVRTGLESLDGMTGGIAMGCLTIVAARPSVGKSSLGLRFAESSAERGAGVLFVSMEMRNDETIDRYIAGRAGVHLARLRGLAPLEEDQVQAIAEFSGSRWSSLPIFFDDRPRQTLSRIVSTVRLHVSRHKVKVVVVDYLGIIAREDHRLPMHEHIGNCTGTLKALAVELGVGMVVLCQLNRGADDRGADTPPRLSDLKSSGNIEEDGDNILLMHRRGYDESAACTDVDVEVAKQRNGPTGRVTLQYLRAYARFEENPPVI